MFFKKLITNLGSNVNRTKCVNSTCRLPCNVQNDCVNSNESQCYSGGCKNIKFF